MKGPLGGWRGGGVDGWRGMGGGEGRGHVPATRKAYLRDSSAREIRSAATLRKKLQTKVAVSTSPRAGPVTAGVRAATGVASLRSPACLQRGKRGSIPICRSEGGSLSTGPPTRFCGRAGFVGCWMVASNMRVFLRDGPAQSSLRATLLR